MVGRREKPIADRLENSTYRDPNSGCWLWTGQLSDRGYGRISVVGQDGKRRFIRAHRLSYELRNGQIPDGLWVLHSCDVAACINPDHLRLGTHRNNMGDMCERVTFASKLTPSAVQDIRTRQVSYAEYARRYRVSPTTISDVMTGATWGHLPPLPSFVMQWGL